MDMEEFPVVRGASAETRKDFNKVEGKNQLSKVVFGPSHTHTPRIVVN